MQSRKPLVGISQCLLGFAVRYDGKSKANKIVLEKLNTLFEFYPVCPEVEAGLGVPRPPVQLTSHRKKPNLTGRDDPSLDVTNIMRNYCDKKTDQLKDLDGFIFKSRSPSCGLNSTPIFINGECVTNTASGIFSEKLCQTYPELVVIEESQLDDKILLDEFINRLILNKDNN